MISEDGGKDLHPELLDKEVRIQTSEVENGTETAHFLWSPGSSGSRSPPPHLLDVSLV